MARQSQMRGEQALPEREFESSEAREDGASTHRSKGPSPQPSPRITYYEEGEPFSGERETPRVLLYKPRPAPAIRGLAILVLLTLFMWGCGPREPRVPAGQAASPVSISSPVPAASPRSRTPAPSSMGTPTTIMAAEPALPVEEPPIEESSTASIAPVVQKIYRGSDVRPVRDDARAAEFGVHKYTSSRLILYTDIDPEQAQALPEIVDQAYDAWVTYFGELPPNREGTPYQMTGYLIDDPQRFVAAGMLPEGPPMFRFGRHSGAEFWMNKMNSDYYRRHLLIHEATHCFMTTMLQNYPPRWYLEGMAEYFGTHVLQPDGQVTFGVLPQHSENFPGLGRIELIHQELAQQHPVTLAQLGAYTGRDWDKPLPIPYAWSWAVCQFLDAHPHYQQRFRELGAHMEGDDFRQYMSEHFEPERALLAAEWTEFSQRLIYGYDVAANAFVTHTGPLEELVAPISKDVPAAPGWQSSGLHVTARSTILIEASGEVILNSHPRPWRSEPQGISIEYAAGHPIGMLLAAVLPDSSPDELQVPFEVFRIGQSQEFQPHTDGELWLRVNDRGDDILNNTGSYRVTIRRAAE